MNIVPKFPFHKNDKYYEKNNKKRKRVKKKITLKFRTVALNLFLKNNLFSILNT